jgi:hypothetical protein
MKIITRRNYKKYDKDVFQNKLIENYSWNNSISDVEILADELLTSITESLDLLCPREKYKILISIIKINGLTSKYKMQLN